jgi:hypothetical protein
MDLITVIDSTIIVALGAIALRGAVLTVRADLAHGRRGAE